MKSSSLLDTRVIYCGDNLEQLRKLPDGCVDLIYIDPPFNSNRNYEVFWGETKEKRAFEDRHESTQAYIDFMRPRCVELARVLKTTGSFYYHCDWHASHYVKVMLDQIFGENNFQNEIVWKRHYSHNDPKKFGCVHDVLLYYIGGKTFTWNQQRDKVGRPDIDQFEAAMARTKRKKGFFVGFGFSSDSLSEINSFFRREHTVIVPLTVREILDETIAQKLS
jgi:adenine specific DNA methylase Mod